ncbi:phosphatidylinositol transfer protein sfh5 [Aspergillus bombycis]|uniref:Phosphatidylinositol transfer protein SFH5 n=1 Tax=Aspergillus bombycis TaxID=109264 RepID=A0A1F7ZM71_9EURO|nr:phosphatidylinositol transfer protein sfh5 [Aspergillus bombycis]OGM40540.1 phosphatidylinositol transfer protein sfh5 [Aspergillus bombycis]
MADQQEKTASAVPQTQPPTQPAETTTQTTATPAPEVQAEQTQPTESGPSAVDTTTEQPTNPPATEAPKENAAPAPAPPAEDAPAEPASAQEQQEEEKPADNKPEYLVKNPALSELFERLPTVLSNSGHDEMWGVPLRGSNDVPTVNVLIKFLRANEGNVKLAEDQLTKALQWRKQTNPTALVEGCYSAKKFGGLGYLSTYKDADGKETIITWNIYGGVKDLSTTFGNVDEFINWRVALMELAVKDLKMDQATSVIDYEGEDPYQMIQVHDYLNVSFLRMNPSVKAATKKTIDVFATAYPELLREKFFVNVPSIMGWMFTAIKVFLSKNTTRKFHPISNGANLAREFPPAVKEQFPKVYGGSAPALHEGARTVALEEDNEPAPAPAAAAEPAEAQPEQEAPKQEPVAEAPKEEAPKEAPVEAPKEEPKQPAAEEPAKTDTAVTTQETVAPTEAK